jgi:hypothetical protein
VESTLTTSCKNKHSKIALSSRTTTATMEIPLWAKDPTTGKRMTCPVQLRGPCEHIIDKSTCRVWFDLGNTCCPVCQAPLKSLSARVDRGLLERIEAFTEPQDGDDDSIQFPFPEEAKPTTKRVSFCPTVVDNETPKRRSDATESTCNTTTSTASSASVTRR